MMHRLEIARIVSEAPGVRSFVFRETLPYEPGQFLTLVFRKNNGGEDRRSYSLSSTNVLNEPMQITVKRVSNGDYSRWLVDEAKVGDAVYTTGASGFFVLPEDIKKYASLVFFAAGSGITPIFSLIKTVLHLHPSVLVHLVYSSVSPEATIFHRELEALRQNYPQQFVLDYIFSDYRFPGRRRLNVDMIGGIAERFLHNSLFYICGPLEYMRTITIVLRTAGVSAGRIRREIFHVEKPPVKELPPDALPHMVHIRAGEHTYSFEVQYPATILQTAKSLGIPLPFSCEAGQCGTCAATCISGKVWMWHNDVLLDDEIANGRILTCTGYPVGGDVELLVGH